MYHTLLLKNTAQGISKCIIVKWNSKLLIHFKLARKINVIFFYKNVQSNIVMQNKLQHFMNEIAANRIHIQ